MSIAYYNGIFCDFEDVRIPLSDRAVFFGDGIYDAAMGRDGKIYLEEEHLDRFFSNAKKLAIPLNLTKSELSYLLHELILKNGFDEYFLYFQLTRHSSERIHAYPYTDKSNLLITLKKQSLPPADKKISLISREDIRYSMCDVKTLNLLPAVMASRVAEDAGCGEAVFIRDGIVTECAHSNVAIVKNGVVYTHPLSKFILPGITRARMLSLCERNKIPYCEKAFGYDDMTEADEILITSTTKLCLTASKIDGIEIKNCKSQVGNILKTALREDFLKHTKT
jgi:D-alanine transaminase